jgi:hypothetical protein
MSQFAYTWDHYIYFFNSPSLSSQATLHLHPWVTTTSAFAAGRSRKGVNGLAGQLTAARPASTFYFLFLRRRTPPTAPANCHQAPPATHGGGPPHAARPRPLPPCAPSSSRQTMVALVDAVVAIAGRVAEAVWDMRSSCLDPPVGGRAAALRRGLQRGHPASAFTRVDRRVRSQPKRKHMIGVDFLVPVKSASIYSTPEETLPWLLCSRRQLCFHFGGITSYTFSFGFPGPAPATIWS